MLAIMIFKGQIVVHKLQDLYDNFRVNRYVEKAPSESYSIVLKDKLILWGMDPLLFKGNKIDADLIDVTTRLVFKIIIHYFNYVFQCSVPAIAKPSLFIHVPIRVLSIFNILCMCSD